MKSRILKSGILAAIFSFMIARPVLAAYIDPNTGGMLFQLLAVLFGIFSGLILVFSGKIKMAFFRLRRIIRGSKSEEKQEPTAQSGN